MESACVADDHVEGAGNKELRSVGINMVFAEGLRAVKVSKEPVTPTKLARMMHSRPHTTLALLSRMQT
jgi:hypothetical protein